MHSPPKNTKKELPKPQAPLTPWQLLKEKMDLPSSPRKKLEEFEVPRILGNSNFIHCFKKGLTSLSKAASSMIHNPSLTVQSMVFDGLFLMSLGVISTVFGNQVVELLLSISARVVPPASISTEQGIAAVSSPPVQMLMMHTGILIMIMAFAALISFCILEGLSYLTAYKIVGKTQEPLSFVARFSRLSGRLFPAYLLYEFLAFTRDFYELSSQQLPGFTVWNPSLLVPILAILFVYFGLISFSFLDGKGSREPMKQAWNIGFLNITTTFPALCPLLLLFILVELLSRILHSIGNAGIVIGIMILLASACLMKTTLNILFNWHPYE